MSLKCFYYSVTPACLLLVPQRACATAVPAYVPVQACCPPQVATNTMPRCLVAVLANEHLVSEADPQGAFQTLDGDLPMLSQPLCSSITEKAACTISEAAQDMCREVFQRWHPGTQRQPTLVKGKM